MPYGFSPSYMVNQIPKPTERDLSTAELRANGLVYSSILERTPESKLSPIECFVIANKPELLKKALNGLTENHGLGLLSPEKAVEPIFKIFNNGPGFSLIGLAILNDDPRCLELIFEYLSSLNVEDSIKYSLLNKVSSQGYFKSRLLLGARKHKHLLNYFRFALSAPFESQKDIFDDQESRYLGWSARIPPSMMDKETIQLRIKSIKHFYSKDSDWVRIFHDQKFHELPDDKAVSINKFIGEPVHELYRRALMGKAGKNSSNIVHSIERYCANDKGVTNLRCLIRAVSKGEFKSLMPKYKEMHIKNFISSFPNSFSKLVRHAGVGQIQYDKAEVVKFLEDCAPEVKQEIAALIKENNDPSVWLADVLGVSDYNQKYLLEVFEVDNVNFTQREIKKILTTFFSSKEGLHSINRINTCMNFLQSLAPMVSSLGEDHELFKIYRAIMACSQLSSVAKSWVMAYCKTDGDICDYSRLGAGISGYFKNIKTRLFQEPLSVTLEYGTEEQKEWAKFCTEFKRIKNGEMWVTRVIDSFAQYWGLFKPILINCSEVSDLLWREVIGNEKAEVLAKLVTTGVNSKDALSSESADIITSCIGKVGSSSEHSARVLSLLKSCFLRHVLTKNDCAYAMTVLKSVFSLQLDLAKQIWGSQTLFSLSQFCEHNPEGITLIKKQCSPELREFMIKSVMRAGDFSNDIIVFISELYSGLSSESKVWLVKNYIGTRDPIERKIVANWMSRLSSGEVADVVKTGFIRSKALLQKLVSRMKRSTFAALLKWRQKEVLQLDLSGRPDLQQLVFLQDQLQEIKSQLGLERVPHALALPRDKEKYQAKHDMRKALVEYIEAIFKADEGCDDNAIDRRMARLSVFLDEQENGRPDNWKLARESMKKSLAHVLDALKGVVGVDILLSSAESDSDEKNAATLTILANGFRSRLSGFLSATYGRNALSYCVREKPDSVMNIIRAIKSTNEGGEFLLNESAALLTEAISVNSEKVVTGLLHLMVSLPAKQQLEILFASGPDGGATKGLSCQALELAASSCPSAIVPIFSAVSDALKETGGNLAAWSLRVIQQLSKSDHANLISQIIPQNEQPEFFVAHAGDMSPAVWAQVKAYVEQQRIYGERTPLYLLMTEAVVGLSELLNKVSDETMTNPGSIALFGKIAPLAEQIRQGLSQLVADEKLDASKLAAAIPQLAESDGQELKDIIQPLQEQFGSALVVAQRLTVEEFVATLSAEEDLARQIDSIRQYRSNFPDIAKDIFANDVVHKLIFKSIAGAPESFTKLFFTVPIECRAAFLLRTNELENGRRVTVLEHVFNSMQKSQVYALLPDFISAVQEEDESNFLVSTLLCCLGQLDKIGDLPEKYQKWLVSIGSNKDEEIQNLYRLLKIKDNVQNLYEKYESAEREAVANNEKKRDLANFLRVGLQRYFERTLRGNYNSGPRLLLWLQASSFHGGWKKMTAGIQSDLELQFNEIRNLLGGYETITEVAVDQEINWTSNHVLSQGYGIFLFMCIHSCYPNCLNAALSREALRMKAQELLTFKNCASYSCYKSYSIIFAEYALNQVDVKSEATTNLVTLLAIMKQHCIVNKDAINPDHLEQLRFAMSQLQDDSVFQKLDNKDQIMEWLSIVAGDPSHESTAEGGAIKSDADVGQELADFTDRSRDYPDEELDSNEGSDPNDHPDRFPAEERNVDAWKQELDNHGRLFSDSERERRYQEKAEKSKADLDERTQERVSLFDQPKDSGSKAASAGEKPAKKSGPKRKKSGSDDGGSDTFDPFSDRGHGL